MRLLINRNSLLLSLMLGALMALFVCGLAKAGDSLEGIKSRGSLRCGVSDGVDGFSVKGPDGHWRGMDVDFCRALSAAVLGDKAKVIFVPLRTSERFPALKSGDIDVLVRNTTWPNLGRTFPAEGGSRELRIRIQSTLSGLLP